MEFRILGSLEVVDHGRTADLGPPQRRALLALLLLNANQVVSVDRLSEGLWGSEAPANPTAALQVQVSRLRKALGANDLDQGSVGERDKESLIVSQKPGYAICIEPDALDAWRFERLVADAVEALAEGRPAVACQMLTAGLGLWRGPALSDFAYAAFAQSDIARLNELRLAATESLMEAKLALGAHRELAAELEALAKAHPLRERFWAQRMLALYRCGRQAEALRAYQEVRRILTEDVGVEPSPELSRLERAILVHHPELNWTPAPVTGRDGRPLADVLAAPAAGVTSRPDNLPLQLTTFIGRAAERAELVTLLGTARLLTLTGIGGCGKTRLAMKVVTEAESPPADGVWLVDLSSLSEPSLVTRTVAGVLGIREEPGTPLADTVAGALARKQLVLVLDSCEHLLGACSALVGDLLARGEGVRILTTSREALGVRDETVWPVPSLSLPERPEVASYEAIRRSDAVRLFVDRATLARLDFTLTQENARIVATICQRLDGTALAIELAAARVGALSLAQIAAGLDDRFRLLTGGGPTWPPRHQALRQAIDWGHDLLSPPERALLRRLSVFSGGFTLETAEAVCAGGEIRADGVAGLLDDLVAKSFVVPDPLAAEPRFRLLDTIRHYGRDRLVEAAEAAALSERHGSWFATLAERADAGLSSAQRPWLERLEAEHDNLRAAFEWAMAHRHVDTALRLAGGLIMFWRIRGHYSEGREWCEAALSMGPDAPPAPRAKARWGQAFLAAMLGDFPTAIAGAGESLRMCRQLGDDSGAARSLLLLGNAEMFTGDPLLALPPLEESVALARSSGDTWCLATALSNCGQALEAAGDIRAALPFHAECLTVARLGKEEQSVALALQRLGFLSLKQGDYRSAETVLTEALEVARELGDPYATAKVLMFLGVLRTGQGSFDLAADLLAGAVALAREVGSPSHVMFDTLCALGELDLARGEVGRAGSRFEEALELVGPAGNNVARAFRGSAAVRRLAGDVHEATAWAEKALGAARRARDERGVAAALQELGTLARLRGDDERAGSRFREALGLSHGHGDRRAVMASLEAMAGLVARHAPGDAARLLGAAQALRDEHGYAIPTEGREAHEADVAAARSGSADRWRAAWEQGQALPVEEAVALALGQPTEAMVPPRR